MTERGAGGELPPHQVATSLFPVIGEREPEPFDAETWRLDVDGLVDTPLSLSFEQLRDLPHVTRSGTIHCGQRCDASRKQSIAAFGSLATVSRSPALSTKHSARRRPSGAKRTCASSSLSRLGQRSR